ncbi:hypothetical protein CYMTET_14086, partial [Cymbomonas tetramitiformis]
REGRAIRRCELERPHRLEGGDTESMWPRSQFSAQVDKRQGSAKSRGSSVDSWQWCDMRIADAQTRQRLTLKQAQHERQDALSAFQEGVVQRTSAAAARRSTRMLAETHDLDAETLEINDELLRLEVVHTLRITDVAATCIQAVFRGWRARRLMHIHSRHRVCLLRGGHGPVNDPLLVHPHPPLEGLQGPQCEKTPRGIGGGSRGEALGLPTGSEGKDSQPAGGCSRGEALWLPTGSEGKDSQPAGGGSRGEALGLPTGSEGKDSQPAGGCSRGEALWLPTGSEGKDSQPAGAGGLQRHALASMRDDAVAHVYGVRRAWEIEMVVRKVQALWRGRVVRLRTRRMRLAQAERAQAVIALAFCGLQARRLVQHRYWAATRLQATLRGVWERHRHAKRLAALHSIGRAAARLASRHRIRSLHRAASRIQAHWRSLCTRRSALMTYTSLVPGAATR